MPALRRGGRRQQRAEQLLTKDFPICSLQLFLSSESLSNGLSSLSIEVAHNPVTDSSDAAGWRLKFCP